MRFDLTPGTPQPLGAHVIGDGVNFALFSAHADAVDLCLFAVGAEFEHTRIRLRACSEGVWHGHVHGLGIDAQYGYRVHGPYAPRDGHRFNPYKLCIDPYARHLSAPVRFSSASYGFVNDDPFSADAMNREDSAALTPRAVVTAPHEHDLAESMLALSAPRSVAARSASHRGSATVQSASWRRTWANTVIYEAHVGGMTRLHASVAAPLRGSFAGLAQPQIIEHLLRLGVTAIELLPVQAFADDAFLVAKGLRNYWGYSTLGFFAPEYRYLAGAGPQAFRAMVDTFHGAGIEVILDVVYNHTAEGSADGPTLSFRGIDNASYYRLSGDDPREYRDFTGCGNTLNMEHPRVRELVLDSLRYWAGCMGVDGFRFDLATTLAREDEDFVACAQLFRAIAADPQLSTLKLIAEPWDLGPDGYRLGGFPPGWAEWNDRYRDTMRRFWRGDEGMLAQFAQRFHGSSDLFDYPGRGPWSSVNFIASHDGFTAMDLSSYSERHNEANGEGNRDGHSANYSCNHGAEGVSDDPRIRKSREQQVRNLLATVLLSQGTPMLLAGDEFARTQGGNNNAYCQDNETNWMDWSLAGQYPQLLALTQRLAALRRRHRVLRREDFPHGNECGRYSGFADITWLHPRGTPMASADWEAERGCVAVLLCEVGSAHSVEEDLVLLIFNATSSPVEFALPFSDGFLRHFDGWQLALCTTSFACSEREDAVLAARDAHATDLPVSDPLRAAPGAVCAADPITVAASCVCVFEPQVQVRCEQQGQHRGQHRDESP